MRIFMAFRLCGNTQHMYIGTILCNGNVFMYAQIYLCIYYICVSISMCLCLQRATNTFNLDSAHFNLFITSNISRHNRSFSTQNLSLCPNNLLLSDEAIKLKKKPRDKYLTWTRKRKRKLCSSLLFASANNELFHALLKQQDFIIKIKNTSRNLDNP